MVRKAALAAIALIASASSAAETDWFDLGPDKAGTNWALRFKDFALGSGEHDVWVQYTFKKPAKTPFVSGKSLYRFNCSMHQMGMIQDTRYRMDGTSQSWRMTSVFPSMEMAVPDSIGEYLLNLVCKVPELK